MEEKSHKIMRGTVGVIFILFLVGSLVLLYVHYFGKNISTTDTNGNSTSSESADSNNTATSTTEQPASQTEDTSADAYYNKSVESAKNKNYTQAIAEIDEAIKINNTNDVYWAKKATYYSLAGDTAAEKATLEEGLRLNPNSDLLKTRLDVIGEDISTGAEGVRE